MIKTKQKNGEMKKNKKKERKKRQGETDSYYCYHLITFLGIRKLLGLRVNFDKCKSRQLMSTCIKFVFSPTLIFSSQLCPNNCGVVFW